TQPCDAPPLRPKEHRYGITLATRGATVADVLSCISNYGSTVNWKVDNTTTGAILFNAARGLRAWFLQAHEVLLDPSQDKNDVQLTIVPAYHAWFHRRLRRWQIALFGLLFGGVGANLL